MFMRQKKPALLFGKRWFIYHIILPFPNTGGYILSDTTFSTTFHDLKVLERVVRRVKFLYDILLNMSRKISFLYFFYNAYL